MAVQPKSKQPEYWLPALFGKQWDVWNCGIEANSNLYPEIPCTLLVAGGRYSGKTWACIERVLRHMWETPGARVAMFARQMKNLTMGGSFMDLIHLVLPEWVRANVGFQYTTFNAHGVPGPKTDTVTRAPYFRIRNRYGGESELILFSLNNEENAVDRLKNLSFSMIYFSELTNFENHEVVRASHWQLRMNHLKPWQHMFLADTNPSEDGENHWVYKYWFLRKALDNADEKHASFFGSMKLIQMFMADNPLISDARKEFYRSSYDNDPGGYDRDILGKWTRGHGNAGKHFADLYVPKNHVIGEDNAGSYKIRQFWDNKEIEIKRDTVDVATTTTDMFTGWDIGHVNHAVVIMEKRIQHINERDYSLWICHDEVVSIGERLQLSDITELVLEKIHEIEARTGRRFDWTHYADDSVLDFRAAGAGTDALEIDIASRGEIVLQGVSKPRESVKTRVKMLRRLLKGSNGTPRFYVAVRCVKVQQMLQETRRGSSEKEYIAWDENKHPCDAVTYVIFKEEAGDLLEEAFRPVATEVATESNLVSV